MRLLLALWLGKFISIAIKLAKSGGGSAAPGYYALKICPDLVEGLSKQIPQNVVITGTNGKTTTARLLSHFVSGQKLKVVRNSTGSNLERGVASALIAQSDWTGKIQADLGIWELDEAAFNKVVFQLRPQLMVFLNAFRDQLDRYGEVDTVVKKWHFSLGEVGWESTIIVNSSDPNTSTLTVVKDVNPNLNSSSFGIKNHFIYNEVVFDAKKEIKPFKADFEAINIKNNGLSGTKFEVKYPNGKLNISFHIPGIYHIYDFLAAFSAYYQLNLPINGIQDSLKDFSPAFGRVEQIKLNKHTGYIFLIKNPAGATQVIETIAPEIKPGDRLLIALNDNFADGKDVSWIWDAGFEKLVNTPHPNPLPQGARGQKSTQEETPSPSRGEGRGEGEGKIICSGSRAQDLALRLKYAGANPKQLIVQNDLNKALFEASEGIPEPSGRLFILPTYTALLELQGILAKMGVKKHYWKDT